MREPKKETYTQWYKGHLVTNVGTKTDPVEERFLERIEKGK